LETKDALLFDIKPTSSGVSILVFVQGSREFSFSPLVVILYSLNISCPLVFYTRNFFGLIAFKVIKPPSVFYLAFPPPFYVFLTGQSKQGSLGSAKRLATVAIKPGSVFTLEDVTVSHLR
jgi:hypothetical protein